MLGKNIMSYLIAGTLTTGVVVSVLNSDNMDKLTNALNLTKNKITQYESNEEYLVSKYGEIKANAEAEIAKANSIIEEKNMRIETLTIQISEKETEIADLEKQLENNASNIEYLNARIEELQKEKVALEAQKSELEKEIETLKQNANTEIEKANAEIDKANQYIADTLETVNEINAIYTPLTTEELEGITGKLDSSVVDNSIAAVQNLKVYFYKDHTQVTFELPETIDLSMGKQGNIIIKLTDENGVVTRKDKTWAGYLNDSNGNKYGQGIWNNTKYSNTLNPGVYSTTVSKTIKKVELIVTNNNGVTTTLTATN